MPYSTGLPIAAKDEGGTLPADIWGESEAVVGLKARLSRASKVNRPVLISGERGSGKELVAARLHYLSPRWKGPYVALNCAALNPNLLESELFGYEPGAFTGAARQTRGRFEAADGGTLFLDEISHLSLEAQAKILRVVEYGSFQRLGSTRELKVDVRLVSATNTDLATKAAEGFFLPDLLDRLSFEIIRVPPLREREGDVALLAHLFAARMANELDLNVVPGFTLEAMDLLERHSWPGNVRELKNTVERAVYQAPAPARIELADIELTPVFTRPAAYHPDAAVQRPAPAFPAVACFPLAHGQLDKMVGDFTLGLFDQALQQARFNQKEAARLLGISYHRFRFLKKKYNGEDAAE